MIVVLNHHPVQFHGHPVRKGGNGVERERKLERRSGSEHAH